MTRRLVNLPALRQIEKIHQYIARDDVRAADKVVNRIYAVIDMLVENPRLGRQTLKSGLRMFVVDPYSYLIFFRYLPKLDELHVTAVRHGARRHIGLQDESAEFRLAAIS